MTHIKHRVESRVCNKCGETKDIIQRHKHATNTCDDCQRERSKKYQRLAQIKKGRRVGISGRVPYPLAEGEDTPNHKFRMLSTKMFKIKEREEWILELRKRLNELFENKAVMDWIYSHKDDDDKPKKQTKINKEYPDTRYITWEEYTKGLGEDDVDS
jgi:protein-arginine kinase activator protein McsA